MSVRVIMKGSVCLGESIGMTYQDAIAYMEAVKQRGIKPGIHRLSSLLDKLGNPQNSLKFIHVAGTNGKGSVCEFLSTILKTCGYRVGTYTSPALESELERYRVNGEWINHSQYAECIAGIKQVLQTTEDEEQPTLFEIETALAFLFFKKQRCDLVVLETGMGGLLDATNVVTTTILCVLTSISMDHCSILGNTIDEITENKAGIIKDGVPVVTLLKNLKQSPVIEQVCREKHSRLVSVNEAEIICEQEYDLKTQVFSYGTLQNICIRQGGRYQQSNAALAIEAAKALQEIGFDISMQEIYDGLYHTYWPYRMECICKSPVIILDGAHNPDAANRLKETIQKTLENYELLFVMGIFADKDYEEICKITCGMAKRIIITKTPDHVRALETSVLKKTVEKYNQSVQICETISEAADCSILQAGENNKNTAVIVFGSLSYLAEFKQTVVELLNR